MIDEAAHALRRVLRRPSFTLINGVTLGLALGASVLAFAVFYGYLFRPLPYVASGQLLAARQRMVKSGMLFPLVSVEFYDTLKRLPQFHGAGLYDIEGGTVTAGGQPQYARFTEVTPSIFTLLGVKPVLGRTLSETGDRPDGPREVVLSYSFWQSAFGGAPGVIGRSLQVQGRSLQVVGVMPRHFLFPIPHTALWTPFVMTPARVSSGNINYMLLMRMPRGWDLARVNALLGTIRDRELERESPAAQARARKNGYVIDAVPYRQMLLSFAGGAVPIWGLFGFTLLLLVMTTLNSTNLALARQRQRLGELSLRQVLGAGRAAIVRLTLLEYLPILLITGLIAAALAVYCIGLLHAYQLPSPYMPFKIRFGWVTAVYLIAAALAVMLCVAGGAVIANLLSRSSAGMLNELAQRGSASRAFRNAQRAMAATQIGIALVLVICGTLLSQSLIALIHQPLYFRSQHVTVASVMLPKSTTSAQFWQRARPALRALPGTRSVAMSYMVPFAEPSDGGLFHPAGNAGRRTWAWTPIVSRGFFRVMDIHFVAGGPFTSTDERAASHDVIVSAALAHALFGKTDVVGETLDGDRRIIGVAPTLPWKLDPASDHNGYAVYLPMAADGGRYVQIVIRSDADSAVLQPALHRIVAATAPDAAIYRIRTLPQIMRQASLNRAALTSLVIGFGAVAFLIAVFGVYAIVTYGTRLRLFEFAIRQVLGASRRKVLALTLREIGALLIVGGAVGIAIAYVAVQGLRSLLYGVAVLNPTVYLGSFALIAAAVLLAAALPVWRATQLNPADIMRE